MAEPLYHLYEKERKNFAGSSFSGFFSDVSIHVFLWK